MNLRDRLKKWWAPAQWREDHPLTEDERRQQHPPDAPDDFVDPQHGFGAESYDRVDVERDFRKQ
jgi:hypothetical protein